MLKRALYAACFLAGLFIGAWFSIPMLEGTAG